MISVFPFFLDSRVLRLREIKGFRCPSVHLLSSVPAACFQPRIMTLSCCRVANFWKGKLWHKFPTRGHLARPLLGMWGSSLIAAPPSSARQVPLLWKPPHPSSEGGMKVYLEAKPMGRLASGSDKDKISWEELALQRRWAKNRKSCSFLSFSQDTLQTLGWFYALKKKLERQREREFGKLSRTTGASPEILPSGISGIRQQIGHLKGLYFFFFFFFSFSTSLQRLIGWASIVSWLWGTSGCPKIYYPQLQAQSMTSKWETAE